MKKSLIAASLVLASVGSVGTAQADVIFGVYGGAQYWDTEVEGGFGSSTDQQRFAFNDENQNSFYIAVEHPIPLIPNVMLRQSDLITSGATTLTSEFEFNGQTYTANTNLNADLDLSHTDYTLYYEIFDNDLLSIDLGVTGKRFDGFAQVRAEDGSVNSLDLSGWVPTAYGHVRVGIPATAVTLYAKGNFLAIDDSSLRDVEAGIEYRVIENLAVDVNVQLAYRDATLELEDVDSLYSDLSFKGPYLGVEIHF